MTNGCVSDSGAGGAKPVGITYRRLGISEVPVPGLLYTVDGQYEVFGYGHSDGLEYVPRGTVLRYKGPAGNGFHRFELLKEKTTLDLPEGALYDLVQPE